MIILPALLDSIHGTHSIGLWNSDSCHNGPQCIVFVIRIRTDDCIGLRQGNWRTKWLLLCRRYFFIQISNFVPKGSTDNKPILQLTSPELMLTQFNGDDVKEIRNHLPRRWVDYSGCHFIFNWWNPVNWIMEFWQLKIQTIMHCLCDNTKQRWLDMSLSQETVTKWLTFCRQYSAVPLQCGEFSPKFT